MTSRLTAERAAFRRLLSLGNVDVGDLGDRALSILAYVCERGPKPPSVREIAADQGIHVSQVSRHTAQLRLAGLIERHVAIDDARSTVIKATVKGRALDSRIQRIVRAVVQAA